MKPKLSEMKILISAAIERDTKFVRVCDKDTNPQTILMVENARGRLQAWDSVKEYLNGLPTFLKLAGCVYD